MNEQWLKEWQQFILETAKKILLEENRIMTQVFILTRQMNIDAELREIMMDITEMEWRPATAHDGTDPLQYVIIGVPIAYEDPRQLLAMLAFFTEDRKVATQAFSNMTAFGKRMNHSNPERYIVEMIKAKFGMHHDKDIVATWLREFVRLTEAEAFAKVDEMYVKMVQTPPDTTIEQARENVPKSLKDDLETSEAIGVVVEDKNQTRMVNLPFTRSIRDVGKVLSFGEPIEFVDDGKGPARTEGRFVNVIRPERAS